MRLLTSRRLRPGRGTSCFVVLLLAFLALPAVAGAHAEVVESDPADGVVLDEMPPVVRLAFSDRVTAGRGSIQAFAPGSTRVEQGSPVVDGAVVEQDLRDAGPGTYGVAYRVSSEDGHVITGTLEFSVGRASGRPADSGAGAAARGAEVDVLQQVAFSAARFVELLAVLTVVGGGLFVTLMAPEWRPRMLAPALVALLLAHVVAFLVQAATLSGTGVVESFAPSSLRAAADAPFGRALAVRALLAVAAFPLVLLLRHGPRPSTAGRAAAAIVFVALGASTSIAGHAAAAEPAWLRVPADMLHVLAACVWLGGLVQLGLLARFAHSHLDAIRRFSRVAFGCVVVLLASGAYGALAELGSAPGAVLDSRYGRLVLAKLLLFAATIPLAWNNMGAYLPRIDEQPDLAPVLLRRYVWREAALLVVVVALTAWLVATPQP